MSKRAIEISTTYTPGKNLGHTRRVTVDRIPASEVTFEGVTDVHLTFPVAERVEKLVKRALRSNDLAEQRITYTAPIRALRASRARGTSVPAAVGRAAARRVPTSW
jgi:hypothetical protein